MFSFPFARRKRQTPSHDYGLFILFFFGMFFQNIIPILLAVRLVLMVIWGWGIARLAIHHRKIHHWQWPGLTPITVLKSIGIGAFWIWAYVPFAVQTIHEFAYDTQWEADSFYDSYQAAIGLFPHILSSKDPLIGFMLIPLGGIAFSILVNLKLAYAWQEEFIQDCNLEDASSKQQRVRKHQPFTAPSKSRFLASLNQFRLRPFLMEKTTDSIAITFYRISAQDLNANPLPIIFASALFAFFGLGTFNMIYLGLPGYLNDDHLQPEVRPVLLVFGLFQCLIFAIPMIFIWVKALQPCLARRILCFQPDQLVVKESVLGYSRELFRIDKEALVPLEEEKSATNIPDIRNTALYTQRLGKRIELAGHLFPEAMDTVQSTYDCYRETEFNDFYRRMQPVRFE